MSSEHEISVRELSSAKSLNVKSFYTSSGIDSTDGSDTTSEESVSGESGQNEGVFSKTKTKIVNLNSQRNTEIMRKSVIKSHHPLLPMNM